MRKLVVVAALVVGGSFADGCRSGACPPAACVDGATFSVRVALPATILERAAITFCRNDACGTRAAGAIDGVPGVGFRFEGALTGQGSLRSAATTACTLVVSDDGATVHDGDHYTITATDPASGTPLLAFDRTIQFDRVADGTGTCSTSCLEASSRVYPQSASGLTCTGVACRSGVTITGRVTAPAHDVEGATFTVCRNADCVPVTFTNAPTQAGNEGRYRHYSVFDLDVGLYRGADGSYAVTATTTSDPVDLADGDHYKATMTNPSGGIDFAVDAPVTYATSFPNGEACDVVPCRQATLAAP